ncbi:deoxycytidyl transferase, partial [Dimargaris verticillata]
MSANSRKRREPLPPSVRTMGEYMACKIQKLGDQGEKFRDDYTTTLGFQEGPQQSGMHALSKLFARLLSGLRVFVTGFTEPPSTTIRRLTLLHGGEFIQYLTVSDRITVIIATQLTPQKICEWGSKRLYRIVRPEWLVQSISQGKRLPWVDFALLAMVTPAQPSLDQTFGAVISSDNTATHTSNLPIASTSEPGLAVGKGDPLLRQPSNTVGTTSLNQQYSDSVSKSVAPVISGRMGTQCTTDPNFLNHYYQSSRLHLLSSFKNELQHFVQSLQRDQVHRSRAASPPPTIPRVIMYVDFDCFFVAVGLRTRPHLAKRPVAVSHCQNSTAQSSSDIASCNYIARKSGVKNGMRVGQAQTLCPDLIVIPYEFDAYKQVSKDCYRVLVEMSNHLQVGSMDEAVLDVTEAITSRQNVVTVKQTNKDEQLTSAATTTSIPEQRIGIGLTKAQYQATWQLAHEIRQRVRQATQCQVSIGISTNVLLAKIATRWAKPNGQHYLDPTVATTRLWSLSVRDLPGVGWSLAAKLRDSQVSTVGQLQTWTLSQLQSFFGRKKGQTIYEFARGIDSRPLFSLAQSPETAARTMAYFAGANATITTSAKLGTTRQSIGTEVGWGVRLETQSEVNAFVERLCEEVAKRMTRAEVRGQTVTLKIKKRRFADAEPVKYMGHGICDTLTKSINLTPTCTRDPQALWNACQSLLRILNVAPVDVRAVGIQVQKLVPDSTPSDQPLLAPRQPTVINWLQPPSARLVPPPVPDVSKDQSQPSPPISHVANTECLTPAPSTQIDIDVWQALPQSVRREIQQQFSLDYVSARKALCAANMSPSRLSSSATTNGALAMPMPRNHLASPVGLDQELFVSPSKWDPAVAQAIPHEMRRELELVQQHRRARLTLTNPPGQAVPATRYLSTSLEGESGAGRKANDGRLQHPTTDSVASGVSRVKVLSFQPCDYDNEESIADIPKDGPIATDSDDFFAQMEPLTPFRQVLDLTEIKQFPPEIQRDIAAECFRPRCDVGPTHQLRNPADQRSPKIFAKPPAAEPTECANHLP